MLSRSATTTAVTSTSLATRPSPPARARGERASWMRLITAKHRGTNADSIGRGTAETGAARPRAQHDDEGFRERGAAKNESHARSPEKSVVTAAS